MCHKCGERSKREEREPEERKREERKREERKSIGTFRDIS